MKLFLILLIINCITIFLPASGKVKIVGTGNSANVMSDKGCSNGLMKMVVQDLNDEKGYKISYLNFDLNSTLFCDQKIEIDAATFEEILEILAHRYSNCIRVNIDKGTKRISIEGLDKLFNVASRHQENKYNEYFVNDIRVHSFSQNENKERTRNFCIYDESIIPEWLKTVKDNFKSLD